MPSALATSVPWWRIAGGEAPDADVFLADIERAVARIDDAAFGLRGELARRTIRAARGGAVEVDPDSSTVPSLSTEKA